jgi:hypothetical protein
MNHFTCIAQPKDLIVVGGHKSEQTKPGYVLQWLSAQVRAYGLLKVGGCFDPSIDVQSLNLHLNLILSYLNFEKWLPHIW